MRTMMTQHHEKRHPDISRPAPGAAVVLVTYTLVPLTLLTFLVGTLLLFADSLLRYPGALEYQVLNMIQGIDLAFAESVFQVVDLMTGSALALALCGSVLVLLGLARKWGAFIVAGLVPAATGIAVALERWIANRSVPDPSALEPALYAPGVAVLPSAQVIGSILLFGLLFVVARDLESPLIRYAVQGVAGPFVPLVAVSQLWFGALWPAEVLTAVLIGSLMLIPMVAIARRVDRICRGLPLVRAADVVHDERLPHARALTSTVVFNQDTVSKVYRPGFLPRAIYWLAFQAEFPYMRNQHALRAAVLRRNLIGRMTEFWYGENHVARAIGIDQVAGRYAITSEFVDGGEPEDRRAARTFLADLAEHFEAAGFPTWQIDPRQPRATDNVVQTNDGRFRVIDLESGLVSPLASVRAWKRAFSRGLVPMFDDIFFDVTRDYIARHEAEMRERMGDDWVRSLLATLDDTEQATSAWHNSEPRIWSRLLGRKRSSPDATGARRHWAIQWFEQAIRNWRDEGRISGAEASELSRKVQSPQFLAVMPHFGVHLGTGILLRFPLGSIARTGYTAFQLSRVTWHYLTGRIDRGTWRDAAGIHSPLVIALAAVPGFGAFAYLVSRPIRSDHLLLRVALDAVMLKVPGRLYQRFGLRWLVTDMPSTVLIQSKVAAEDLRSRQMFGWTDEHRQVSEPGQDPWTVEVAASWNVRGIA